MKAKMYKLIGVYVLWFSIHLVMLITLEETFEYKKELWPFIHQHTIETKHKVANDFYLTSSRTVSSYDYSDFLLYTIIPVFIALGIIVYSKGDE